MAKKKEVASTIVPRLLNIEEASQYMSTTTWAVRKLLWSKEVPHIKLGTRLLIDKQDLDAFINRAKLGGRVYGTACNAAGVPRAALAR